MINDSFYFIFIDNKNVYCLLIIKSLFNRISLPALSPSQQQQQNSQARKQAPQVQQYIVQHFPECTVAEQHAQDSAHIPWKRWKLIIIILTFYKHVIYYINRTNRLSYQTEPGRKFIFFLCLTKWVRTGAPILNPRLSNATIESHLKFQLMDLFV